MALMVPTNQLEKDLPEHDSAADDTQNQ